MRGCDPIICSRDGSRALKQETDPQNRTTTYVYDANYNVIAITNAQGKVTRFTYEPTYNKVTSVVDPLGRTTSFGYDASGNLTSITNALGKVTTIAYNQFGQPTSVTDPLGNAYTFGYNETLDLVSVKDPLGNEVKRAVDGVGRPIALIDSFGRTTRINYTDQTGCGTCGSAPDLVSSIVDPLNGTTSFGYDSVGNLTNVTDALTHTVSYEYDEMSRLKTRTDQLDKTESYFYDKNGNVTNFVDRRGVSVVLKYDTLDRRTGIVYGAESSVRLFYDKVGRVTNVNDSIAGNIALTYDSLDRLMQETNAKGIVNYLYNDAGLRTTMTVVGETLVGYLYDTANRLTNVVQGTLTASLSYDDAGRRTKLILPNGINVLYSYDDASRLTNITYQGAVTNRIDYRYDDIGNRVSQASALAAYLLPNAVTNSTYNAANQQLVFGSYAIQYDDNGNATTIANGTVTNHLAWSARNQLTNMLGAVIGDFKYDGLGRRIERTVAGVTEKYLYDGFDIIQQLTDSGAVGARYFRSLGIDEPWLRSDVGAATTNRIYLADALGNVVALTDSSRNISNTYAYEPFGATTTTGPTNKNSYKFTAREDDGTGLYYYRTRYYHPALGRFVSEDAIEYLGGDVDLYNYTGQSPTTATDPFGLLVQVCFENISVSGANWRETAKRLLGRVVLEPLHGYINVKSPQIDLTIELEGPRPGCRHGNPATRPINPKRPCIPALVTRPVPEGDYSFEYNILEEFFKYYFNQASLPDYDQLSQNSNAFVKYLITSQGGKLDSYPVEAYGINQPFVPIQPDSSSCHCK